MRRGSSSIGALAALLAAAACGTQAVGADSGDARDAAPDAPSDGSAADGAAADAAADSGRPALDCGAVELSDAGPCDPVSVCPSDPPPSAQQLAKCQAALGAACGALYAQLVRCGWQHTSCSPQTCATDPVKSGKNIQQYCASLQQAYDLCVTD